MTTSSAVMAASTGEIADAVSHQLRRALTSHGTVRTDGRSAKDPSIQFGRAMIHRFADDILARRTDAANDTGLRSALIDAIADGLGYVEEEGQVAQRGTQRADASYLFPGEGVFRDPSFVRPPEKPRRLIETIPTKEVPDDALVYETRWGAYEGSAGAYRQGMTQFPTAGASVGASLRQLTTIVTSTNTPWDAAISARGSFNRVAEDAEAARRAMLDFLESALVGGIPGEVDWQALRLVPAAQYLSPLNYGSSATTIGDMFTDLIKMFQAVPEANDDRGAGPTVMLAGSRFLRRLMRTNNLDDGGFSTGSANLGALVGANAQRGLAMSEAGVEQIVSAPYLNGIGPAGANANYDMVVMFRPDQYGLRWVRGLAPAPVRTVQLLHGDSTLWAMRACGVEAPNAVDVGIAFVQVAA